MVNDSALKAASFLFKKAYFVYKPLYFQFKKIQDKSIIELCKSLVKPGDLIADVGANIGFYSSIFSGLTGTQGHVYSFEPDQKNFKKLKKNISGLSNCTLVNSAVGQRTEKLNFYTSHRLNVDHRTVKPEKFDSVLEVDCFSLDDYLKDNTKLNFIKMDIQGAEMNALLGMKNILSSNKDLKIISELWPYSMIRAGYNTEDMITYLNSLGYSIRSIEPDGTKKQIILSDIKDRVEETFDLNIFISREN